MTTNKNQNNEIRANANIYYDKNGKFVGAFAIGNIKSVSEQLKTACALQEYIQNTQKSSSESCNRFRHIDDGN